MEGRMLAKEHGGPGAGNKRGNTSSSQDESGRDGVGNIELHESVNGDANHEQNNSANLALPSQEYLMHLIESLAKAETTIEHQKLLIDAHKSLIEVSLKNSAIQLELDKTKLKILEAQIQNKDEGSITNKQTVDDGRNFIDETQNVQNTIQTQFGPSINSTTCEEHQSNLIEGFNQTIKQLHETISTNSNSNRISIKRDYKLTSKLSLKVWMDYLTSELTAHDLLDVVDESVQPPTHVKPNHSEKRNNLVRDIIINRVDSHYHNKILNIKDAKDIIKKLKECKKIEMNVSDANVRAELYKLKKGMNEKIDAFSDRFDAIVCKHESCETSAPLTEIEIQSAFYNAVAASCQELKTVSFFHRHQSKSDLSVEEIKSFMLHLEADKKQDGRDESKVNLASSSDQNTHNKAKWQSCFRCDEHGHFENNCPLKPLGLRKCYHCKRTTDHIGDYCPQNPFKKTNYSRGNYKRGHHRGNNSRGHRSRGGFFRGNDRGRVFKRGGRRYTSPANNQHQSNKFKFVSANKAESTPCTEVPAPEHTNE